MASTNSTLIPRGDPQNGGALFTLPREIRDEIYRLLVKRRYTIFGAPLMAKGGSFSADDIMIAKSELVILRLSQAISREALEILYSESILRYQIGFRDTSEVVKPPAWPVNHMKKVKMVINGLEPTKGRGGDEFDHFTRVITMSAATIRGLEGSQILRDSCHVQFLGVNPEAISNLEYIIHRLAAFTGFRTLLIEVFLETGLEADLQTEMKLLKETGIEGKILEGLESVRRVMRQAMEPFLGPATTSHHDGVIRLEFHPCKHVPSMLRAQAQKLLLEAERLERRF